MLPDDTDRRQDPQLDRHLDGARESTRRLMASLHSLTDAEARRPSLLPGWTNGHVLTHLARNADGIASILDGALHGTILPMYPGGDTARNQAIQDGAGRRAAALVADLNEAAGRLDDAWSRMHAAAWQRVVVPRLGEVPAWQLLPARRREVEIHRVDLNLPPDRDYRPDTWPAEFVADLVSHLVETGLGRRMPTDLTLDLVATDTGARWTVGSGQRRAEVSGPAWALGCWLAGRTARVGEALAGDPPDLGPWR
ncbi:MAG TPA: maleylpyruvate isomerase family mycothiol-dependent enzyme [Mycobacteriales bacterium]|nr:maleylpyruvate isomerase family mycothiol-dependent enzyme [Mycobacteriales bacterium]